MSTRRIRSHRGGLVPGIRKLGRIAGKVGLAVSLHAPNDSIRSRIVPMNERYSMADILEALAAYPLPKRRRITIEYTLIRGVNDEVAHARELAVRLKKLPVKVNLIPMNSIGQSSFEAATDGRVEAFREALADAGFSVFVRKRRGDEVGAACGQLVLAERLAEKRRSGKCSGAFS
jgi:23S rRNA (adenine2503-C2)-methyltransferase